MDNAIDRSAFSTDEITRAATLYFVEVWSGPGQRHEDAVIEISAEMAAKNLGARVFPGGLDPKSAAWRAVNTDTGEWFGTVGRGETP